jgi:tetratricopeptide (TPR) repeat protein
VTAFSGAAAAAPGISKYRYNLGLALARANAYEQARTEFETAIRLDPANLDARKALRIVTDTLSDDQAADIAAQLQR